MHTLKATKQRRPIEPTYVNNKVNTVSCGNVHMESTGLIGCWHVSKLSVGIQSGPKVHWAESPSFRVILVSMSRFLFIFLISCILRDEFFFFINILQFLPFIVLKLIVPFLLLLSGSLINMVILDDNHLMCSSLGIFKCEQVMHEKCKHSINVFFCSFSFFPQLVFYFCPVLSPSSFYLFISSTFFGVCHFDFHDGTASAAQTCSLFQCSVVNVMYGFISKLSPLKPILYKLMVFSERISFTFQHYVYTFHYLKHAFKQAFKLFKCSVDKNKL